MVDIITNNLSEFLEKWRRIRKTIAPPRAPIIVKAPVGPITLNVMTFAGTPVNGRNTVVSKAFTTKEPTTAIKLETSREYLFMGIIIPYTFV
jgi:hypothetical protein